MLPLKRFPCFYKEVADRYGCAFFNAAEWIKPLEAESIHLDPDDHRALTERLSEVTKGM